MCHLFYLTVERHVILVFLQKYLTEHTCIGDTFVDGELRKRCDQNSFATFDRFCRVNQSVFGADNLYAVVFPRIKTKQGGCFLAYSAVSCEIKSLRLDRTCLENRKTVNIQSVFWSPFAAFFCEYMLWSRYCLPKEVPETGLRLQSLLQRY